MISYYRDWRPIAPHMSYIHSPRGGIPHGYSNGYAMGGGAQPHSARMSGNGVHGFTFRSRHERIDWKKIASIDLDRIMRELDVSSLQDSIMGITFCDIEREIDTRLVDQNFVTVFKLAQLIIQYLLHSQEVMAHNASVAEERVQQLRLDQEGTKAELTQLRGELEKVKQESHKRKKLLKNQQTLIQATANNYHKCMYCQKAFFSVAYLQAHIHRKHPEFTPRPAQQEDSSSVKKVNEANEKLERELEELRERLKFTESQLVEEKERAQEQMKMHLQQQQNQMDTERQEDQHRKELEKWKQEQLNFQKVEMEKMQNMFMKELKEMHDKYSSSQNALSNIESKLGKQSMLGKMMDEDELEEQRKLNKKQQREMSKLKEHLQGEISTLQSQMMEDLKKQEDKWREKQKELKGSHREEVKELKALLKQTKELLDIEREGGDQKGAKYQKQIQDLMKKNKDFEKQIRSKEDKIKDLKVKASKHYEVVQPLSSPPPQMTISDQQGTTEDNDDTSFEGMDTLSRVLQESESWLTGTHPSYNLSDSDVSEDELDAASGNQKPDQHHTFSHNKERIIAGLKDELSSVLQRSLEKRGVPEGMRGISAQSLENKVRVLKQERQQLAKQHAKFYDIRERFKREVDRKASEMKKSGKPVAMAVRSVSPQGKKKPTTLSPPQKVVTHASKPKTKAPVQKPHPTPAVKKMSPGQVRTPPPVVPRGPMPQGKGSGTPTQGRAAQGRTAQGRSAGPQSAARVSFEDESEEDEEDESEEEEEESESFDDEDDIGEDPIYKTPHVPPRPVAQPQPATNGFHSGQTEGDMEDESESEWDSEDISELEEVKPVGGRPTTASRQPQGPMVASLTKSIEMQLSGRRQGQKPVGGVDIGGKASSKPPQPAPRTPSPSPTPRIPTIPDAGSEDDEDSQSLSFISSLGDSISASAPKATSPTPAPRKKPSNDTDMSSNTYGTSMWGSSKAGDKSRGGGTGKSSIVSVTDFDDDDDDLSLDEL
ncbi:uncharacterized protein [Diadema antillarum]|uniref:uncharacterized protein n=1 Tax=Diadema antillarum TaxID=105358 RepID=UPI003A83FD60